MIEATLLDFRFRLRSFKSIQSEMASFKERGLSGKSALGSENGKTIKK